MEGRKVSTKGRQEDLGCPTPNHKTGQGLASLAEQKTDALPRTPRGRGG